MKNYRRHSDIIYHENAFTKNIQNIQLNREKGDLMFAKGLTEEGRMGSNYALVWASPLLVMKIFWNSNRIDSLKKNQLDFQ